MQPHATRREARPAPPPPSPTGHRAARERSAWRAVASPRAFPNAACTPAGTADPCKTYTSSCSAQLTSSTCVVGGNQPDATPCGSGLICDVGTCRAACTAGVVCTPPGTANPCKTYATTCSSNLAQEFCGPVANRPDGTACGTPLAPLTCNSGICQAAVTPPASPTLTPAGATASPGLAVVAVPPRPHGGHLLHDRRHRAERCARDLHAELRGRRHDHAPGHRDGAGVRQGRNPEERHRGGHLHHRRDAAASAAPLRARSSTCRPVSRRTRSR